VAVLGAAGVTDGAGDTAGGVAGDGEVGGCVCAIADEPASSKAIVKGRNRFMALLLIFSIYRAAELAADGINGRRPDPVPFLICINALRHDR